MRVIGREAIISCSGRTNTAKWQAHCLTIKVIELQKHLNTQQMHVSYTKERALVSKTCDPELWYKIFLVEDVNSEDFPFLQSLWTCRDGPPFPSKS